MAEIKSNMAASGNNIGDCCSDSKFIDQQCNFSDDWPLHNKFLGGTLCGNEILFLNVAEFVQYASVLFFLAIINL